jgi:hypothetical protein
VNPALITGLNGPIGIAVSGSNLFVANQASGTIGEYTTSGATVNAALVTVPPLFPHGIAASGSDLFVDSTTNTIGEYTTSGATVNPALITGLNGPLGIAVSGSDLFVANNLSGTIGEYTTSGATVNPALITGLNGPYLITVVPDPPTALLFGSGLVGLALAGRRRARLL